MPHGGMASASDHSAAVRPHVLVPFAWTDYEDHKVFSIKSSVFERALRQFIQEVGQVPWSSARRPRS